MEESNLPQIICPHCGWVNRKNTISDLKNICTTYVTQGWSEKVRDLEKKIKSKINDEELNNANAWLDMPPCPKCGKVYQYNLNTGKTKS